MLSEKEVRKINDEVDNKINEAIKYSEKSSFPDTSEITEEVYG
jgi:TPP-dependent pyruvate/acetoin dehydrogenase alpha subunit